MIACDRKCWAIDRVDTPRWKLIKDQLAPRQYTNIASQLARLVDPSAPWMDNDLPSSEQKSTQALNSPQPRFFSFDA